VARDGCPGLAWLRSVPTIERQRMKRGRWRPSERHQRGWSAMKCVITLLLLALFALTFWTYRSRLNSGFKVLTIAYIVIFGVNIARLASDEQNVPTLIIVGIVAAALWLAIWLSAVIIEKRKAGKQGRQS
jgi:hypothetical protein